MFLKPRKSAVSQTCTIVYTSKTLNLELVNAVMKFFFAGESFVQFLAIIQVCVKSHKKLLSASQETHVCMSERDTIVRHSFDYLYIFILLTSCQYIKII